MAKFWSSLFRRQPFEKGAADPVENNFEAVRRGFTAANDQMKATMEALLDDQERRQNARRLSDASPPRH